jgi:magnesium transporter
MKNLQTINLPNFRWLNITNAGEPEIEFLRSNFNFHPLDYEDVLAPRQRPKLDDYQDYIFMILTFPFYDRESKEIRGSELDIFIGHDYLITCSDGQLEKLNNLFWQCKTSDQLRQLYAGSNPTALLYHVVNKLQHACLPMIEHINSDVINIEKQIFSGQEKKMVAEILLTKRNINAFRKLIRIHKTILLKFISHRENYYISSDALIYYNNLIEQTKEIWDSLEGLRESIGDIHNTNESLISFRLNDIMRTLTVISVIFIPINFIAFTFSMRASGMPIINQPNSFWLIIATMALVVTGLLIIFKKKKWL